jgi:predicted DsbA family dithiol-disulfide isomerase
MKIVYLLLCAIILLGQSNCQSPNKTRSASNALICNPDSGICETQESTIEKGNKATINNKSMLLKIIYFTDPICSACWGIEPQLRKLKLEYGEFIEIEYRMGGLLPDWSYNSGGISKPSDVAHHWDEVSKYYDMPIDGDLWLEDPLSSSYPPSIAFKAAQMQSNEKAVLFLREIREMVFLHKKNITNWMQLEIAAKKAGLNTEKFKADYEGSAKSQFESDLNLSRSMGVRGFPTLILVDTNGRSNTIYGSKPYKDIETTIQQLIPSIKKNSYSTDWKTIFKYYPSLTAREYAELTAMPRQTTESYLDSLVKEKKLEKFTTKNGSIWRIAQ